MSADLTREVTNRLETDHFGWLTTVAKSGQPVPRLVWFYYDGSDLIIYSQPDAGKVRHLRDHPRVSLNLDSDGQGGGIIVIGGQARVDAEGVDCRDDGPYWQKYAGDAEQAGLTDAMGSYSTRIRIGIDRVWTTPTEA
ncbi:TIGR03667 family PPOX class F420-dependent oxidoreductase [Mycolicibacterium sp. S2-37]|uniref:TIGR03667 family PPOX class F420-dependent oxidoreductase n=1 Tax=Mycolicibacterium sp. S2-37 TaxID=2810297 RepID=UPI001A950509|nr:TIGR03667 family PPOX class F420-dependent oxidoreductase [Mycolicibacterium sp. S2-37]MBO0677841.1 TIGR03667 family PPOX class F420-dependent oxidoreductase [Mycolicibacterium sp. S2-37]